MVAVTWSRGLPYSRHCAKCFASITPLSPRGNSGRFQDHLPFTVRKLKDRGQVFTKFPRLWRQTTESGSKIRFIWLQSLYIPEHSYFHRRKLRRIKMAMIPWSPDAHVTGSPHLAGEKWVMSHKWIWGTWGLSFISLFLVGWKKLLNVTQTDLWAKNW